MNPAPFENSKYFNACEVHNRLNFRMNDTLMKAIALNKRKGAG